MATIRFTEADRNGQGRIRIASDEPRSLEDLLPMPAEIKQDARRQTWTWAELAGLAVVAAIALFILAYAWATPNVPTVAPPTFAATLQPTAPPTLAPVRLLPAFAAPDGLTLGIIEATRPMTPTAHYGANWIQAQVAGSGLIWLRASDAPALPITGPDLAPRPTEVVVARPIIPAPVPPPPPCAEAGIPGQMVRVCGYAEISDLEAQAKQQWLDTYGGNIGIVKAREP